jgi:putative membrane protein
MGVPAYRVCLLIAFVPILIAGCIDPHSLQDLILEHILTLLAVGGLWAMRRRPLSNFAYTGLFIFLVIHVLGAH